VVGLREIGNARARIGRQCSGAGLYAARLAPRTMLTVTSWMVKDR
jgi:hypothetical protein